MLENCIVCPRNCGINRLDGETGFCRSGAQVKISSAQLHFGEEPPISGPGKAVGGRRGSGTIFFSNCNLACAFCQNYEISQEGLGHEISEEELADTMLKLAAQGAHNINLVSPSHFGPQIIKALTIAKAKGLNIPIVYNSNGYDGLQTLKLLDGLIDVYIPDMKYGDNAAANKFSGAPSHPAAKAGHTAARANPLPYVETSQAAVAEMFRQVGPLETDKNGIARRGLLVRHLVLPNRLAGSHAVLDFLASLSTEIPISIMAQYYPTYRAAKFPELNRRLTKTEYREVVDYAQKLGFKNLLVQDLSSHATYRPEFKRETVFENS
ncbi:MAG: radical SAM protein [Candidatus Margulisiibacteriota bacterium]